jgi:hypothetical protein
MTQKAFKTIAIAAALSALSATSGFAQAAIQEPGLFAFYHPYLDVLNGGAPTPAARLAERPASIQAYAARESASAASARGPDDRNQLRAWAERPALDRR